MAGGPSAGGQDAAAPANVLHLPRRDDGRGTSAGGR
jgi:hypothetical protein